MMRALALLLIAAAVHAQTVEGTVRDAVTGNPVPGAWVVLRHVGDSVYSAVSDRNGQFRFENVDEGTYAPDYSAQRYMDIHGSRWNPPIQVKAGATVRITGSLVPMTRVRGRVVDGRGDAVSGARVSFTSRFPNGAQTGADGQFDLPVIGFYENLTLTVSPSAGWKPPARDPQTGEERAWARTYYPGVALRELAAPILVPPGSELDGLLIKLLAVPVQTVRGVLLDPEGHAAPKVSVALWDPYPLGESSLRAETLADGSFAVAGVPEGEWRLAAETQADGVALQASQWIEVTARPANALKVRLSAPISLGGRVIFERPDGMPAPKSPRYTLDETHSGEAVSPATSRAAEADAGGRFQFQDFYPGTYRFHGPSPRGFYLDAILLGNGPAPPEMEISAGSPELTVVYKSDGGTVRGKVEECDADTMVLLASEDEPGRPVFTADCGADQRFEIESLRPGGYSALALRRIPFWRGDAPPVLLRNATRVAVRAGETTEVDLRIYPTP